MKTKYLRNYFFILHRLIGMAIGFLLVIVGITGSLLVFRKEWDDWLVRLQFGTLTPQAQLLPTEKLVDAMSISTRADRWGQYLAISTVPLAVLLFAALALLLDVLALYVAVLVLQH
jgi:disulfide bond formation protein DsbB